MKKDILLNIFMIMVMLCGSTNKGMEKRVEDEKGAQTEPRVPYSLRNLARRLPQTPIYQDDFVFTEGMPGGSTIASFYKDRNQDRWMGKIGLPRRLLFADPANPTSIQKVNLGAALEKIGADLFFALSDGAYKVATTCLSLLPVRDATTQENILSAPLCRVRHAKAIRCMSKIVEGYKDLGRAETALDGQRVSLTEFFKKCSRPPTRIYAPDGTLIRLEGMIELLAAIKLVADIDGLGGKLGNAGFIMETDEYNNINALIVKIDPGYAFQLLPDPSIGQCTNKILIDSRSKKDALDHRDIQVVSYNAPIIIRWQSLKDKQKRRFLDALERMMQILQGSEEDLLFCFDRNGAFTQGLCKSMRSDDPRNLVECFKKWIEEQKHFYHKERTLRLACCHHQLPQDGFERSELVTQLSHVLAATKDLKVAVLYGQEKAGKSELAKYFAYKQRSNYSLIFWMDCSTPEQIIHSYERLSQALNLSTDANVTVSIARVHEALEQKKSWLLIFDDVKEVLPLPSTGGCVLITCREKTLWPCQHIIEVPSWHEELNDKESISS